MPRPEHLLTRDQLAAQFGPRVFTTAQAEAAGISRARLRSAVAAGLLTRLQRGLFSTVTDPLQRARTHQQRLRQRGLSAVLAERCASPVWGLWEFGPRGPLPPPPLTLFVPPDSGLRLGVRSGVLLKAVDLRPEDVTEINGVPITTPLRTGFDVARTLGLTRAGALVPLNSAMRAEVARRTFTGWRPPGLGPGAGGTIADSNHDTPPSSHDITEAARRQHMRDALIRELSMLCDRVTGRGARHVRNVLADVEPLTESWLESVAWAEITHAPIPRPEAQVWVKGASGRWYRADFLIAGRVVLEVDGAGKYADLTPWQEKQRQSDLEAAGYWVVRCTWEELLHHPERIIARILHALDRVA